MDVDGHCVKASPNQSFWSWRNNWEFGYERADDLLGCPPNGQYEFIAAGEEKLAAHYHRIERM
jgi:hypothetical protein